MLKKLILACVLMIVCTPAFARNHHVRSVPAASQPSALDAWYGSASEPVFVTRGRRGHDQGTDDGFRVADQVRGAVRAMIAEAVRARLGSQWIASALHIAKIESGFRCNARNGRAVGVFQNIDPARFGVSRREAATCSGGIRAGVAHMAMCINAGARNEKMLAICHNTGRPYARHVERAYRWALR